MGKALRSQQKDPSQLKLSLNADGSMEITTPGWPAMKLKSCQVEEPKEELQLVAPQGSYCGSVPLILDMRVTFNGNTMDFYNNVKVAKQVIDCKAEPETFDASSGVERAPGDKDLAQVEALVAALAGFRQDQQS